MSVGELVALLRLENEMSPSLVEAASDISKFDDAAVQAASGLTQNLTPAVTDLTAQATKAGVSTDEMAAAYAHVDEIIARATGTQRVAAEVTDDVAIAVAETTVRTGMWSGALVTLQTGLQSAGAGAYSLLQAFGPIAGII